MDFGYREWLALSFAREWIFTSGKTDAWELFPEYNSAYTGAERRDILKLVKTMDFFNFMGKMFIRIPWKYDVREGEFCLISPSRADKG